MADTPPLVNAIDVIRLVGKNAFDRAQAYARQGAVAGLDWQADQGLLVSTVQGSEPRPYRCRVHLERSGDLHRPVRGYCSCPMASDCKHVAATLLAGNLEHLKRKQDAALLGRAAGSDGTAADGSGSGAGWKAALDALTGTPVSAAPDGRPARNQLTGIATPATTAMGLTFELREQTPRTRHRWQGQSARTATEGSIGQLRLGIRPSMRSAAGNWVKGDLTWTSLGYIGNRSALDIRQQRWFSELYALYRSAQPVYVGEDSDWLYLDQFHSPLLWNLLEQAETLGIPLLAGVKGGSVTLGHQATLALDATTAISAGSTRAGGVSASSTRGSGTTTSTGSDLHLSALLTIDDRAHSAATAGSIGSHGVYAFTFTPAVVITLAPTTDTIADELRPLLGRETKVVVPAGDVPEFLDRYYPPLRQRIAVTSSDESVSLPAITPPTLVLTVSFQPKHTVELAWDWQYPHGRMPLHPSPGESGYREPAVERDLLTAAGNPQPSQVLHDIDAAEFVHRELPRLASADGIRVDTVGDRPDYRELTETPKLTVSTVETDQRDWFDLGVIVTIGGKKIPFSNLFTAMAKGKKKLLLIDGSYFSLQQPELERLRELIAEAETLAEWETGPRISRYQASLWADFEDLADETDEAIGWRQAVGGLRDITSIDPTPLPDGITATLRPYQLHGFRWLSFLWQHGLGGILADDMGLGKTLQTIALITHARQTESRPFLVVAPTSVVGNWALEIERFAPHLKVATVTSTNSKGRMPLADAARGADVVVTSYALFRLDFDQYQGIDWAGLILDEAQFVKNRAARVHVCARELTAPFKLAITGTPMENNLLELHALFSIVAPGLFPSARRFSEVYAKPIETSGSAELLARLRRRIRPLMMRRTKDLVAADLPAKQEQVLQIELGPRHRRLYDTTLQRERQKLLGLIEDLDKNRFIVFRSLTLLRMLSLDASLVDEAYSNVPSSKLDALFEQLEDVLAEGHRALIFSQFTSFLKKAAARLDEQGVAYSYLDGSTTRRAEVIKQFKQGDNPVFLISLKAGGFGLTLTEADYVFLLDPWWNPATEAQAIDRTHRIGQTRHVNVYRMIASGTIEEKVMALKERKARLFDSVMDDDAVFSSALTADDIRELLEPTDPTD
ncbi:DEAD/DEAH box helicase [Diaminobutyricimonas sp. LJ205]|uniref:DEAD/DEAH box helicase n=1 Tax=Diaminobutyricimonas sp. LJ205 TaxID=2683590 RepID=UPI0012F52A2E|nr:DEAD/DEAH box helicase [Diaminobutyricimonas sp. LJ205]